MYFSKQNTGPKNILCKQNPYLEIIHRILANKNVFRKQNHFKKSWKFDKCHMQVLKNHPMHFSKQNHLQQTKVAM